MRGLEDREVSKAYLAGCDILGAVDMSSVMPWLSLFTGGVSDKDKAAAAEAERKRAEEKARQEAAARTNAILYTGLAVIGTGIVGAGIYLIARRK